MISIFSMCRAVPRLLSVFAISTLTACHAMTPPPDIKSRTEILLDEQYAASGTPTSMQADEADKIHEGYIESLGKGQGKEHKKIE